MQAHKIHFLSKVSNFEQKTNILPEEKEKKVRRKGKKGKERERKGKQKTKQKTKQKKTSSKFNLSTLFLNSPTPISGDKVVKILFPSKVGATLTHTFHSPPSDMIVVFFF